MAAISRGASSCPTASAATGTRSTSACATSSGSRPTGTPIVIENGEALWRQTPTPAAGRACWCSGTWIGGVPSAGLVHAREAACPFQPRRSCAERPGTAPLRSLDGPEASHPLPRRRRRPRRQGHQLRRHPRRGRPGRAGRALRRRGRRRAGLPRHHRLAREPRHDRRAGAAHRRQRLHPVHDRRRHPLGRGRAGGARRRAPTRSRSTRRRWSGPSCSTSWPTSSAPSAW